MKTPHSIDLQDSLLPGPLVLRKLKTLLGDEGLKSFDLLAFIKIDPSLMLQFLNFSILLDPNPKKRPTSLEEATSSLKKEDIHKFIQLELLKAEGFTYSREFCTHYMTLWQEALFNAAFLEVTALLIGKDSNFAYTLGLLSPIDRLVECYLEYGPTKKPYIQSKAQDRKVLSHLPIPEALLSALMAQKDPNLVQKDPLAYTLTLAYKLREGQKVDALPSGLGFGLEALPSLYKKAEKRLQDIQRFISVF